MLVDVGREDQAEAVVAQGLVALWGALILLGLYFYGRQLAGGLAITGMSRDVTWGFYIAQFTFLVGVAASAVMVNDHTAFRVDWMPFAGLKHSGYGVGGIPYTFRDMQVEKMMVIRSPSL